MKHMKKCLLCFVLTVMTAVSALPTMASGDAHQSYTYTYWGNAVSTPDLYCVQRVIRAEDSQLTAFKEPQDVFVDASHGNTVYVADTGHNRVVVYDADFRLMRVIESVIVDGKDEKLSAPTGVFADARGNIFIADQGHKRALRIDRDNRVLTQYTQPQTDIGFEGVDFLPRNVLADTNGFVYVLCNGLLDGAAVYTLEDGAFQGYYGANAVEQTFSVMMNNFWKQFLNETQRAKIEQNVPDQVSNFDIDKKNFIYTCTENAHTNTNQIKKFNLLSVNVLRGGGTLNTAYAGVFGDLKVTYLNGKAQRSRMVDVCCDEDDYLYGLDFTMGRIFMYAPTGELVGAFGVVSGQEGGFQKCIAIDNIGTRLVVLDSGKNDITVFERTAYTNQIVKAQGSYQAGDYQQALKDWQGVLQYNHHLELAINGLGKAQYNLGNYTTAMQSFHEGNDRDNYEKAFKRYRSDRIRVLFPYAVSVLAVVIIGIVVLSAILRRRQSGAALKYAKRERGFVLHILFHPTDGFDDLREQNHTLLLYSLLVLVLLFISQVASRQLTGFIFNTNDFTKLNLFTEFCKTIMVFILWVICHWAVTTLFAGKATPREIWTVSAVALTPYVLAQFVNVLLSNVLLSGESMFMTILLSAGTLWSVWILLAGLMDYQEFSLWKLIGCIVLTLVAMLIVVFVIILLFSLFQQVANYVQTIVREIMLRVQ